MVKKIKVCAGCGSTLGKKEEEFDNWLTRNNLCKEEHNGWMHSIEVLEGKL